MKTRPEEMTIREARGLYFEKNGFGPTGGYDDAWVDFKLGPIPMPFPNTKARVRAVGHHDVHHVLTGYDTDIVGEFEIAAWEIGAGCKDFGAAWVLNLGGMAGGLVRAPRRSFAAFVRGRGEHTTYGENLESVLDLEVREAQRRFALKKQKSATLADVALWAVASMVGMVVAIALLAITLPLVPIGLLTHLARRRHDRSTAPRAAGAKTT